MCFACGQMYCGGCNTDEGMGQVSNCPTCRAPFNVSDEENFKRFWKLVHDRSPGRHTPVAQNALGGMYANGKGVKQDHTEAVEWYRKAADQGFAHAQFNLGIMYSNGQGVKEDHNEAVEWYRKAAVQGHADAQCNLGIMYDKGRGVKQDDKEAIAWCRKAAEQGHATAQYNLGFMYANGQGVLQNFAETLQWWQLAAEQGIDGAPKALDTLQRKNFFPAPPPGTAVTAILLTSGKAAKLNRKTGTVVEAPSADMVRPGLAFVRLDGEVNPKMFKVMNLRL